MDKKKDLKLVLLLVIVGVMIWWVFGLSGMLGYAIDNSIPVPIDTNRPVERMSEMADPLAGNPFESAEQLYKPLYKTGTVCWSVFMVGEDEYDSGVYTCTEKKSGNVECFRCSDPDNKIVYKNTELALRYVCITPLPVINPLGLDYDHYLVVDGDEMIPYAMSDWICSWRYAYLENNLEKVYCLNKATGEEVLHQRSKVYWISISK